MLGVVIISLVHQVKDKSCTNGGAVPAAIKTQTDNADNGVVLARF